jgi:hypothetical protein
MAEEVLVRGPLTNEMIVAGEKLLQRLELLGLDIVASFWMYFPESNEWRLALATHHVDSLGPKKVYAKIWDALHKASDTQLGLDLQNLTVLSPGESLVKSLVGANKQFDLSGKKLSEHRINGSSLDDMYIYYVKDAIKPSPGPRWISK